MRYRHLIERVRLKQPKVILEVGTWNGSRALQMLDAAPDAHYIGFDLFESATKETDAAEMNVKPHNALSVVANKLRRFSVELVPGNTRDTLRGFSCEPVDFVWLDGGHSIETIRSDWANVRELLAPDAEVWFDDYYSGGPDISEMGCNLIVKDLRHDVYPAKDPVHGGGYVQMVRVYP